MTLHLHYAKPLSSEERAWLTNNRFKVDETDWLDVTDYIRYFDKNRINDFIGLICEITSLDLAFDKWELR
jgi:hypothetical protein